MTNIQPFAQLDRKKIAIAGGKGANLGELTRAGFPIPAGFVLTTAAYDAFVDANGLQPQIVDLASQVSAENPQSSTKAAAAIKALFQSAEMPQSIRDELLTEYNDLSENGTISVAVRSSATAEDLPTASFAGQQDTFLNVQTEGALLEAIVNCWASLWTARAIAYRLRQGIAPDVVSLAVVVQRLVSAESSGILFTANPTTGERGEIVINATWGLGEAIVGGWVTPDTVVVDKSAEKIISRDTSTKTTMTVRTDSGTAEQAVPLTQQNAPAIDDATALQLARFGAQIEAHYNVPMDVEWAVADGEIFILQARPITSLPPAPLKNVVWEPAAPNTIWMRRQIVEHMPEPLSPLFEDLYVRRGLLVSMNLLLDELTDISGMRFAFSEMIPHGFAATINGYAYTTGSFKMRLPDIIGILRIYTRIFSFLDMPFFNWEGVALPNYLALIAKWADADLDQISDSELLDGIAEMAMADSMYWFGSARNLGLSRIMDPVFDLFLKSPLARAALPEPQIGSTSFLRGFDSKALDAQEDMETLADMIRESAEMRALILNSDTDRLIGVLADHPEAEPVLAGIQRYLEQYGHQIYNLDFADPTQTENPLPMLLSLKALVKNAPTQAVRARQSTMAAERDALVAQTRRGLNPISLQLFDVLWKWTKLWAPYRENVMFYMGAAWPTLRKLAHELGHRLTIAGAIAEPDDIYFLDSDEITSVIEARQLGDDVPAYAQLVAERRTLREARKRLTPPPKIPERGTLKFGPVELSMFDPIPAGAGNAGPVLNGNAVSIGRITAPASVIYSVEDFDKMQPGNILVCTTTTPAWTPLFSQAAGLVTDIGGALAHGSIVAREYGIPAVMGTGVATERIKSGMLLTVDGNAGTVTLLDEVEQQTVVQPAPKPDNRKKIVLALAAGVVVGFALWRRRR
jgi:pyruvate,water dikinase